MSDRSSRPRRCHRRTPQPVVRKGAHLRWRQRLGPVAIADRLGLTPSTVHAVLVRCRPNRLSQLDRHRGEPNRRYEHDQPARCSTSTSRNSATSPTALCGGSSAAPRATGTAPPPASAIGPEDRYHVRPHRPRQPQPGRPRRDPRRRDRHHRERCPAPDRVPVRRPRRSDRARPSSDIFCVGSCIADGSRSGRSLGAVPASSACGYLTDRGGNDSLPVDRRVGGALPAWPRWPGIRGTGRGHRRSRPGSPGSCPKRVGTSTTASPVSISRPTPTEFSSLGPASDPHRPRRSWAGSGTGSASPADESIIN